METWGWCDAMVEEHKRRVLAMEQESRSPKIRKEFKIPGDEERGVRMYQEFLANPSQNCTYCGEVLFEGWMCISHYGAFHKSCWEQFEREKLR